MRHYLAFSLPLSVLLALAGCGQSASVLEPFSGAERPTAEKPTPAFPVITSPAVMYDAVAPSSYGSVSRYVLFTGGTFSLQYLSPRWGFFEYKGRYELTGSKIVFDWDGWSAMGPWGADGVIAGDVLTVRYNDVMQMTDFEDAVYVRSSGK